MKRLSHTESFAKPVNIEMEAIRDYTITRLYIQGQAYGWSPKEIIIRLERLTKWTESIAEYFR